MINSRAGARYSVAPALRFLERRVACIKKHDFKVIGWTYAEDRKYPDMYGTYPRYRAREAVVRAIRAGGFVFGGDWHGDGLGVPVFSSGQKLLMSARAWGDVMSEAWDSDYPEPRGYIRYYDDSMVKSKYPDASRDGVDVRLACREERIYPKALLSFPGGQQTRRDFDGKLHEERRGREADIVRRTDEKYGGAAKLFLDPMAYCQVISREKKYLVFPATGDSGDIDVGDSILLSVSDDPIECSLCRVDSRETYPDAASLVGAIPPRHLGMTGVGRRERERLVREGLSDCGERGASRDCGISRDCGASRDCGVAGGLIALKISVLQESIEPEEEDADMSFEEFLRGLGIEPK